ncbi:MAG: HD-GYP domain-containing protein [Lachnospiraceae bacterium]|nr:HD-GYP domain-containing protein [Lachnospiraceae bacterium]
MVIDQSLVDQSRRVLIARKTTLDEFMISELRKMRVNGVYIREGEEEPEVDIEISPEVVAVIQKLEKDDKKKVQLSESVKKRVATGVQFLFTDTGNADFANVANDITNDLMKAIEENDAIAMNVDALKISDEYTFKHSVDVATMAMIVAKQMQWDSKEVYDIGVAGLLHDVGKSKIPEELINKPGRLTDEEFEIMKQHSVFGYRLLKEKGDLSEDILLGVLQHHEKINGRGYPMQVENKYIGRYARILAVVDVYDALVTERAYKKAFSQRDAIEIIMSMTEELDINAVKSFLNSVILYPVGSVVQLSNGERARVVENSPGYPMRPKVVELKTGKVYDLSEDIRCASIIIE